MMLKVFYQLLLLKAFFSFCQSSSSVVERPRGVSLTNKVFYDSSIDFTCLDGSKTISFSYVNDDYCDCADGSDEPGTSACSNGKFFCVNAGFKPKSIPSSRVNDGICDCCDGSDEWKYPNSCTNNCVALFKVHQEKMEMQSKVQTQGNFIKKQYATEGAAAKVKRQDQLKEFESRLSKIVEEEASSKAEKEEIEVKEKELKDKFHELEEMKKKKEEAEIDLKESSIAFDEMDLNKDGILNVQELILNTELDPDNTDNEFTETEGVAIMSENSINSKDFLAHVWPKIKHTYRSKVTQKTEAVPPPPINEESDTIDDDLEKATTEEPVIEASKDESKGDESEEDDEEEDEPDEEYDESVETAKPVQVDFNYDDETNNVIKLADEKRRIYDEIVRNKQAIESDIKTIKEKLQMDFGPDDSFSAIDGKCFDYKTLEYKYTLCVFDKVTQSPLNSDSPTSLGKWGKWSGPDDNKYSKMKYSNGLACWNGPSRSTEVKISCGVENKVVSVDEPTRCAYLFEFVTPCACEEVKTELHDEL